jgi:hypothetical protein
LIVSPSKLPSSYSLAPCRLANYHIFQVKFSGRKQGAKRGLGKCIRQMTMMSEDGLRNCRGKEQGCNFQFVRFDDSDNDRKRSRDSTL